MRFAWRATIAAVLLAAACDGRGSIATTISAPAALLANADRARIAIYARDGFDCSLAFGPRPDSVVPAIVLPIGESRASIEAVPTGERVLIVDLFDAAGEAVGIGCNDQLVVAAGMTSAVSISIDGYPEVLATQPTPRATFVSPAAPLVIVFSEPMDAASLAGAVVVTRSDGGPVPPVRDPVIDPEDPSGRAWLIVAPFALDLDVEYSFAFDPERLPKSARGLPVRPIEARTFRTDPLADPFRDGVDALHYALTDSCACSSIDGAKRVLERLFAPATRVRIEQLQYIVLHLELARAGERVLQTSVAGVTQSSCAAFEVTAGTEPAGDCVVTSLIRVIDEDCFCREVACDALQLERDEPACREP